MNTLDENIRKAAQDILTDGYAVIESFLSHDDIEEIKKEASCLVEASYNHPEKAVFGDRNQYFLSSSNKISYFYEKNAIDEKTGEFSFSQDRCVAKIGHALHFLNPTFKKLTASDKNRRLLQEIGFENSTVVQSMLIFKNPYVGGEYGAHQDASFLCTEPEIRLVGFWYALDDATIENGCLQFIPGSHKWPVRRRFVLNETDSNDLTMWTGPEVQYSDEKFVQVPVKKGSLVIIHGQVVHRSSLNKSEFPRWAFTFHVIDDTEKSRYSKNNWLQIHEEPDTFMPL